jgi:hypothetical protein
MAPHRRWNDSCRTRISYVAIALAFGFTVSGSDKWLLLACFCRCGLNQAQLLGAMRWYQRASLPASCRLRPLWAGFAREWPRATRSALDGFRPTPDIGKRGMRQVDHSGCWCALRRARASGASSRSAPPGNAAAERSGAASIGTARFGQCKRRQTARRCVVPDSATDHESGALQVQESGVPARTPWRLSPQMQYDRVFPVAMPGELHILPFCAL